LGEKGRGTVLIQKKGGGEKVFLGFRQALRTLDGGELKTRGGGGKGRNPLRMAISLARGRDDFLLEGKKNPSYRLCTDLGGRIKQEKQNSVKGNS